MRYRYERKTVVTLFFIVCCSCLLSLMLLLFCFSCYNLCCHSSGLVALVYDQEVKEVVYFQSNLIPFLLINSVISV